MQQDIGHAVRVIIKGAGDLASGVAARLWRAGFPILLTELPQPLTVRRTVAFAEAVYAGATTVEDLTARRVEDVPGVLAAWQAGVIPVLVDGAGASVAALQPRVLVDGIIAKRNLGTTITDAPLVIGLGPGFIAGVDVHAVVETNRGHTLGRVFWHGSAQPNTGVPGDIAGFRQERVVYAPADGVFRATRKIGSLVQPGATLGHVTDSHATDIAATANIAGVLRGLIHDGVTVQAGLKIGDVDPRAEVEHCFTISDKALAIGGGVLEALMTHLHTCG